MDCERFEQSMVDELYGELDELTSAAAKRHLAGCARCSARLAALRETRRLATIPLVEPPDGLEARILEAAARAQPATRRGFRLGAAISAAGAWAMRPQTAMAAVFLVMIGTSMLLLRSKSARLASNEVVTVTERGTPAPAVPAEPPAASAPPAFAAPPPPPAPVAASNLKRKQTAGPPSAVDRSSSESGGASGPARDDSSGPSSFATAMASYRAGRFEEARRGFDLTAGHDPAAALWSARSVREAQGCATAAARFDRAARQGRQTPPGWDALLEGAQCYRQLGEAGAARSRLTSLLGVDSHKDRARAELARLDAESSAGADLSASRALKAPLSESPAGKAAAPTPVAAPASPPAAAAPAAEDPSTSK